MNYYSDEYYDVWLPNQPKITQHEAAFLMSVYKLTGIIAYAAQERWVDKCFEKLILN